MNCIYDSYAYSCHHRERPLQPFNGTCASFRHIWGTSLLTMCILTEEVRTWGQIFWLIVINSWLNSLKYLLWKPPWSHWYLLSSPAPLITTPRKMSTRLIDVDDASPLMSYQGPWAGGDQHSVNTQWGPPWYNVLHALSGSGSFTFSFTAKLAFNFMTIYMHMVLSIP